MLHWDERAIEVLRRLEARGHRAVLVGGCVRDSLLSIPLHDYDAATSARPEEVLAACADLRCIETGRKHGTITVLSGGLPVEVTTFRREGDYSDHRRPDRVEFSLHLEEDLARRDFTINAMAWEPVGLVDLYGGRKDLADRLVRCVGDPLRRFEEDALRILRGLRLAAQLEFDLHPDTAEAIHRRAGDLRHVAWERIWAEFSRLLCSPGMEHILLEFPDVAAAILPELAPALGFDQRSPHHLYDVYIHCVKAAAHVPPIPALRLAALLHDVGKPASFSADEQGVGHFYNHTEAGLPLAQQALARLRVDNATRDRALTLIRRHHLPVEDSDQWAGRWLRRLGGDALLDLLALKKADALSCAHREEGTDLLDRAEERVRALLAAAPCLTLKDLAVNGRDAMAAGLSGPAVGVALNGLLDRVAEGDLPNDREILLRHLKP